MKLHVNLGDELKNAKVTFKNSIPVFKDFDHSNQIGVAFISEDFSSAEIELIEPINSNVSTLKDIFELAVGGMVLQREGNVITDFKLNEASLQFRESGSVFPSTEP